MIKVQDGLGGEKWVSKVFPGDVVAGEYEANVNRLTPAETERLALLIEEAAEVQQIACKILRHGFESYNPDLIVNQSIAGPRHNNRQMLEKELGDLKAAVHRLYAASDVRREEVTRHENRKKDTGGRWLHHQSDPYCPHYRVLLHATGGTCEACGAQVDD